MKITVLTPQQLSADHLSAWSRLQRSDATLANPFYRPEFAQAVGAEFEGARVAVLEEGGEPVGFWPFERTSRHAGRAIGHYINQYQGAIVRPGVEWSPAQVMRAAGLRSCAFDHLLGSQTAFAPFQFATSNSIYLDLSQGFEAYHRGRGKSATKFISHIFQKDRKAGRDLGEVRFHRTAANHRDLDTLIAWKTEQCHRTGIPCVFDLPWVTALHHRLLDQSSEEFSGMLYTLTMGDRLASAFFCVRSHDVLQGSLFGFDRELSAYAPGFVLLMRVAEAAGELGIQRIDMGAGGDEYKEKIASGYNVVSEGAILAQSFFAPLYRGFFRTKDRLRATRLRGPVRRMRRWIFQTQARLGNAN